MVRGYMYLAVWLRFTGVVHIFPCNSEQHWLPRCSCLNRGSMCLCVWSVWASHCRQWALSLQRLFLKSSYVKTAHWETFSFLFFLNRIFNDDWKILVKILLNVCFSVIWISTDVVLGNKEVQTFVGQFSGALSLGLVALGDILAPSLIPIYLNLPLTLLFHLLLSCQSIDFCNIDSFI